MEDNNVPVKSFQDVKSTPEIVWLGIDFSRVKFVGPAGFNDVHSILSTQVHGMNDVVIKETAKFDFSKLLRKRPRYKAEQVYQHNMNISPEGIVLVTDPGNRMDGSTVQQVVDECKFPQENAIGMMFVAETLDKNQSAAFVWVAFVDLACSKVIATSKYAGRAGGLSFRNFWVNSFFDILKQLGPIVR
jgi:hypothetical protein